MSVGGAKPRIKYVIINKNIIEYIMLLLIFLYEKLYLKKIFKLEKFWIKIKIFINKKVKKKTKLFKAILPTIQTKKKVTSRPV